MKGCRVCTWDMYMVYIYIDRYINVCIYAKMFLCQSISYLFMYASNKQHDKCMLHCLNQCALTKLNPQHINEHCLYVCGTHVIKVTIYKSCT